MHTPSCPTLRILLKNVRISVKKKHLICMNYHFHLTFSLAPPTAPRNLSIIFQDQSVIVVAWLPPSDSGGRQDVVYDITCFQCDSTGSCNNRRPREGRLQYWPMRENNPFTHVTLTGLQPNTSYILRIAAENGVSYLYGPNMNRNAEIEFGTRISGNRDILLSITRIAITGY